MPEVRTTLSDDQHSLLKQTAARKKLTIKALLVRIVAEYLKKESKK